MIGWRERWYRQNRSPYKEVNVSPPFSDDRCGVKIRNSRKGDGSMADSYLTKCIEKEEYICANELGILIAEFDFGRSFYV